MVNVTPKVIIFSSTEGLTITNAVYAWFEKRDDFNIRKWDQYLFGPGSYLLESLEKIATEFNFAIIVASPDDKIVKRGGTYYSMRDNLLFELGLFTGVLGRRRVFLVCPETKKITLPSDYDGLIYLTFNDLELSNNCPDHVAGVKAACMQIEQAIKNVIAEDMERVNQIRGEWNIFITPGFFFKIGTRFTVWCGRMNRRFRRLLPNIAMPGRDSRWRQKNTIDRSNAENEQKSDGIMIFQPRGPNIIGSSTLTINKNGNKTTREFNYFGAYKAPLLNLIFEEGDKDTHIRGVTALKIDTNKETMHGYNLFWHQNKFEWMKQAFSLRRGKAKK